MVAGGALGAVVLGTGVALGLLGAAVVKTAAAVVVVGDDVEAGIAVVAVVTAGPWHTCLQAAIHTTLNKE